MNDQEVLVTVVAVPMQEVLSILSKELARRRGLDGVYESRMCLVVDDGGKHVGFEVEFTRETSEATT